MPLLVSVVVFLFVTLLVFISGAWIEERNSKARVLRERLASAGRPGEVKVPEEATLLRDRQLSDIPALDSLLRRWSQASSLQTFLDQSGIDLRVGNFLVLSIGSAILGFGLLWIGSRFWPLAWVGMLLGAVIPYSYVSYLRARRFRRFEELFPQAIDTLGRAVRAGHAFTTALELISSELPEPVSGEFRTLFEEQKFGMPVRDALMNLAGRVPLVDVKFFVTAVMLQRETGGNLAEILDNLSYMIRERFKILRQVRVYTAQGRLTMLLLMLLPPVIVTVMLVMSPAFIRPLFTDPIGHALIAGGITLQTFGYFFIRQIIQIQV